MKYFTGLFIAVLTLGISACQSSSPTVDGQTHEYTLKQKCPALLELDRGESIVLNLPENPSTGYQWQLMKPVNLFKVEEVYVETEAKDHHVGVAGVKTFTFTAEQAGQDEINLVYVRPWELKDQSILPEEQWLCRVRVS